MGARLLPARPRLSHGQLHAIRITRWSRRRRRRRRIHALIYSPEASLSFAAAAAAEAHNLGPVPLAERASGRPARTH